MAATLNNLKDKQRNFLACSLKRLTPVWVPDQAHEAIRDLVRARQAAVRTLRQARQQLSGFLLRQGQHYHRPAWTQLHRRWLASLKFEQAVHHIVLEDCIAAIVGDLQKESLAGTAEAYVVDRPFARSDPDDVADTERLLQRLSR